VLRLLAHEGAEARAAEMQRLALLVGLGVGDVPGAGGEPLGAERLAGERDGGDEAAPGLHPASQHDPAAQHDEQPVGGGPTLVHGEPSGPRGLGGVLRHGLELRPGQAGAAELAHDIYIHTVPWALSRARTQRPPASSERAPPAFYRPSMCLQMRDQPQCPGRLDNRPNIHLF
jgi:hypothetical protein